MQEIERITTTIPKEIADEIRKIAADRHQSVSGLIADLCEDLVHKVRGTYCEVCHIQNPPGTRFCCRCGRPISEDAIREVEAAIAMARDSPGFRAALLDMAKKDPNSS